MPKPTKASTVVAAKVFALPELLEQILLAATVRDEDDEDIGKPAYALFRALLVSRDFKSIIEGYAKLRRLINTDYLATFHDTRALDLDIVDDESKFCELLDGYDAFREANANLEASWCNMLSASGTSGGTKFDSIVVTFKVLTVFHDEQDDPCWGAFATIEWEFKADDTLGAVWARYERLVEVVRAKAVGVSKMRERRWEERAMDKRLINNWADEIGLDKAHTAR